MKNAEHARVPELTPTEKSILELVGLPGFSLILSFNRDEIEHAERRLLEDKELSLPDVRYYQGYRHAAIALKQFVTNVLEKAEVLEILEENNG